MQTTHARARRLSLVLLLLIFYNIHASSFSLRILLASHVFSKVRVMRLDVVIVKEVSRFVHVW